MKNQGRMSAPKVAGLASNVPSLRLTLPSEMNLPNAIIIPLHIKDFGLPWFDYFRRHKDDLFRKVSQAQYQNRMEIVDNRNIKDGRKTWSLKDTVKQFVNSFQKNRQLYTANLRVNVGNARSRGRNDRDLMPPPQPARPSPSAVYPGASGRRSTNAGSSAVPGPSHGHASRATPVQTNRIPNQSPSQNRSPPVSSPSAQKRKSPSVSPSSPSKKLKAVNAEEINLQFRGQGQPSAQPRGPRFPTLNIPIAEDDAASMADTVDSQDSQSDLAALGDEIRQIRPEIVKNFMKNVDNVTMLRIKNELQGVMDSGKWMRLTARIPMTANFLQMVFSVGLVNQR